jgi:hypothetical protein
MRRCEKCRRALPQGSIYYRLNISLLQGFDGVLDQAAGTSIKDLIARINEQTAGVPESLLEEEVHREFTFILCSRCKEKYCANPLDLPLNGSSIPKKLSDLQE